MPPGPETQLTNTAKAAIQSLAPESQDYVTQMQDLARPCRPRRPRRPSPHGQDRGVRPTRGVLALTPARTGDDGARADRPRAGAGSVALEALLGQAR